MSELPRGWELGKLEDLTLDPKSHIVDGPFGSNLKASEYLEEGIPIVRLQNIDRNFFIDKNIKFISHEKANLLKRHSFIKGDIIITKLGDPLGKACLVPDNLEEGIIVADVVRVRPDERFSSKQYLVYLINSQVISNQLLAEVKGTTRSRVNLSNIRQLQIPIAPLNEQRRIVAKLDRLFARSRCAREELGRVSGLVQRYKQAVLAAAFRGDLTADWRGQNPDVDVEPLLNFLDNKETINSKSNWKDMQKDLADFFIDNFDNLPISWYLTNANNACTKVVDCHNKTAPYSDQGIKLIRTSNIRNGLIDLSETKFVDQKTYEYWSRRCPPESGDIIFTREAPMAEVGMVPPNEIICMGQRMMLLRADNVNLVGKYLLFVLQAPFIRQYANQVAVGTGVKHLRVKDVENLPIVIPPPEEQKEIVNRIEKLFKAIERIEQEHQKASQLLDRLEQATLSKAFRGELVPQDPNDEPAAVLLERIQAEQQAQPKGKAVRSPQKSGKRSRSSDREVNG